MQMKHSKYFILVLSISLCAACTPIQKPDEPKPVENSTYTNERLGFSVDVPSKVTVTACSHHQADGKQYVMPDSPIEVPLKYTETNDVVVFHPERFEEAFGEVETNDSRYYADCRMRFISGALLDWKAYHDFPLWVLLSEEVKSEKEIAISVSRNCNIEAKFTGLEPATQSGVLTVGIDVDMSKTDDTSAVFCPDLVYAKYVPATHRLYYLFLSGPYHIDDTAVEQIPTSWD